MSVKLNNIFNETIASLGMDKGTHPEKLRVMRLSWFAGVASMLRLIVGPGAIKSYGNYYLPADVANEYGEEIHATRLEADKDAARQREPESRADELIERIEALMDRLAKRPSPDLFSPTPEPKTDESFARFKAQASETIANCPIGPDCEGCEALRSVVGEEPKPDKPCTTVHTSGDSPTVSEGADPDEQMYYFGGRVVGRSELSPENPAIKAHYEDLAALSVGESSVFDNWGGLGIAVRVTRKADGAFRVVPYPDDEDISFDDEVVAFDDEAPVEEPSVTAGTRSDNDFQRPKDSDIQKALESLFGPGAKIRFRQL